ncbi:MAG: phosphate signaling complex protein PhoU [Tropicimonas sp.]|uniref:phosphate signaling complex protein PhoU n=1 Tax=Tropicimonas sp. TaxID=2067044 RepID=UPI003A8551B6
MNSNEQHIVSAFDRDLEAVQAHIMKMGGLVETAILDAAQALAALDEELAETVRRADREIDGLEQEIQSRAALMIAERQPVASDLRIVLAAMKIASNLERIGDYAKNMAKRTGVLAGMRPVEDEGASMRRMAKMVEVMLKDALDAFMQRDGELAGDVLQRDIEVDQMYNSIFRNYLTYMMEDPRNITACMHLHFIAKNIERMGDHVTAIAEQTIYLVTGQMPDGDRPKQEAAMGVVSGVDNR